MTKKITTYGIFTALCIVIGYIEHFIPTDMIAPGIKLGLSNTVALLLIFNKDYKGALLVNVSRILITCLLFSSPSTIIYSLSGGIISFAVTAVFFKLNLFGIIGVSICSALSHNVTQILIASFMVGKGVWYYLPILIISAVVAGIATGTLVKIINKKIK